MPFIPPPARMRVRMSGEVTGLGPLRRMLAPVLAGTAIPATVDARR